MKKILWAIFLFASCSGDNDEGNIMPSDGQYVGCMEYHDDNSDCSNTFCLIIEDGRCVDFKIYNGAERFNYYQPTDIRTNGSYPRYTYLINDFIVQAWFVDSQNFTANLSGTLCTNNVFGEVFAVMELETTGIEFKLDNTPLDANDDGLLDSKRFNQLPQILVTK